MSRLTKLLVIVPGIGGSILRDASGKAAWQVSGRSVGGLLLRPGRLAMDHVPQLYPSDLARSFATLGPLLTITGYEGLIRHLTMEFDGVVCHVHRRGQPTPADTDVLLFPYDFRRSITEAAADLADAVRQALDGVSESARRDRVIVVAHSLGGLVARYWAAVEGGYRVCQAILTLGTPHRGAPKALEWLTNGAGWGPLRHPALTRALRTWPSVYELLPQYPAVWDEAAGEAVELDSLPEQLRLANPDLDAYACTFAAQAARARRVHDDLRHAWTDIPADHPVHVAPYFGRGHATTNLATITSDGRLTFTKRDPVWRGNVGWSGDGTVPAMCAIPSELGRTPLAWRELPERHGELASTPGFLGLLRSLCGDALPTRGAGETTPPWLGLDMEDVVPAGTPFPLGALGQPEPADFEGVHATLRLSRPPHDVVFDGPLSRLGSSWRVEMPALLPGQYRVTVEAQRARGGRIVQHAELVALDAEVEAEAMAATVPVDLHSGPANRPPAAARAQVTPGIAETR